LVHSVRECLGLEARPEARRDSFYTVRVAPLFDEHCTGCHGARRQKGKLRLDSFAAVMQGGKHGAVIRVGNFKESTLFARITLPSSNDKVMPPEGKPPLTADELTVIKLWITAGASGAQPVGDFKHAPKPAIQIKFTDIDEAAVERQRAKLSTTVQQLQARYPGTIAYESRRSADLELNASAMGAAFGDRELMALAPLVDHLVWVDLSGTSVSDASVVTIAAMKHLQVLRLENTRVTGAMIGTLVSLNTLRSVTVTGASAAEESLLLLRRKGIKVYDAQ
jgi:hypothetical protein